MPDELVIWFLFRILSAVIKNPAKKAKLCRTLLNVRDQITAIYPNGCESTGGIVSNPVHLNFPGE